MKRMSEDVFKEKCNDPRFVVECLRKYQRWRKGTGEYSFGGDPDSYVPQELPFSGRELSIVEDAAINIIEKTLDDGIRDA